MSTPAEKKWIRNIHVAKSKLKLSDEDYRGILNGCAGVNSSSEIKEWKQYFSVMAAFKKLGFKLTSDSDVSHSRRNPDWITFNQEKYIKGLWQLVSEKKDEESLNKFVSRVAGVDHLRFCLKKDASKVIIALRQMAIKQGINPDYKEV